MVTIRQCAITLPNNFTKLCLLKMGKSAILNVSLSYFDTKTIIKLRMYMFSSYTFRVGSRLTRRFFGRAFFRPISYGSVAIFASISMLQAIVPAPVYAVTPVPGFFDPAQAEADYPTGWLDSVDCSTIAGWAFDGNNPNVSIDVHFYAGAPAGQGGTLVGGVTANSTRADINTLFGVSGNHGFSLKTPDSLKDGASHRIYAYGIDSNGGQNTSLGGNGKVVTCPAVANPIPTNIPTAKQVVNMKNPVGWFDKADSVQFTGWAFDPDNKTANIDVHFYLDGLAGKGGKLIGYTKADQPRADINNLYGLSGSHGFVFKVQDADFNTVVTGQTGSSALQTVDSTPLGSTSTKAYATLGDGKLHAIYAYGIDSNGGQNLPLGGSPKFLQFTACTDVPNSVAAAEAAAAATGYTGSVSNNAAPDPCKRCNVAGQGSNSTTSASTQFTSPTSSASSNSNCCPTSNTATSGGSAITNPQTGSGSTTGTTQNSNCGGGAGGSTRHNGGTACNHLGDGVHKLGDGKPGIALSKNAAGEWIVEVDGGTGTLTVLGDDGKSTPFTNGMKVGPGGLFIQQGSSSFVVDIPDEIGESTSNLIPMPCIRIGYNDILGGQQCGAGEGGTCADELDVFINPNCYAENAPEGVEVETKPEFITNAFKCKTYYMIIGGETDTGGKWKLYAISDLGFADPNKVKIKGEGTIIIKARNFVEGYQGSLGGYSLTAKCIVTGTASKEKPQMCDGAGSSNLNGTNTGAHPDYVKGLLGKPTTF